MFDLEAGVEILRCCLRADVSVSGVVREGAGSHDKAMAAIRELEGSGLVIREKVRSGGVGRPREWLRVTALGRRFVREYSRLRGLPLCSNENDIEKALHQAELSRKLIEMNVSPYSRFQEVNELARNIARSAKVEHHPH